mmetsp:Transcript_14731/g.26722  ORF Transcript_14731/g.26722 Transcript_14731/m.26722 type:complete len:191 (+) Transcript_14731:47-619(+)
MFTMIGNKLTQKPNQIYFDDIWLRMDASLDDASVPSSMITQAAESSYLKNSKRMRQSIQTEGNAKKNVIVFILAGMEPGQKLKIHYSSGTTLRTRVPPRSKWMSKNCSGTPRRFFLVPVPAEPIQTLPPSDEFSQHEIFCPMQEKCRRPSKSMKNVHCSNPSGTVCQCSHSLGVYDSMCPFHGSGPRRHC